MEKIVMCKNIQIKEERISTNVIKLRQFLNL